MDRKQLTDIVKAANRVHCIAIDVEFPGFPLMLRPADAIKPTLLGVGMTEVFCHRRDACATLFSSRNSNAANLVVIQVCDKKDFAQARADFSLANRNSERHSKRLAIGILSPFSQGIPFPVER